MVRLRNPLVVLLAGLAAACSGGGKAKTLAHLQIQRGNAPGVVDHIDLIVTQDASVFTKSIVKPTGSAGVSLPLTVDVPLTSDMGSIKVEGFARDLAGAELARGSTIADVVPGETVTLVLEFGKDLGGQDGGPGDDGGAGGLVITPPSFAYGILAVGGSADNVFTVSNPGNAPVGPLTAAVAGAGASSFTITADPTGCPGMMLAAGASCHLTVRFQPDRVAALSATLMVSAPGGASATADLSGTGAGAAGLTITPADDDLGAVVLGTMGTRHDFVISNTGGVPTGTLASALGGADAAELHIAADGCSSQVLGAGSSCTVSVTLAPTTVGAKAGTLTVGGTPGGMAVATLHGRGVTAASLTITPPAQDFGTTLINATADATFTVSNPGGVATQALHGALTGADAASFTIMADACSGQALAASASCMLTVRFHPTTVGAKSANLTVAGSAGESVMASLHGMVVTPGALTLSPMTAAFGNALIGTDGMTTTFTVQNTGGAATGVPATALAGTGMTQFVIVSNLCTAALPAAGTCTLTVRFHPTSAGGKSASLAVTATPGGTATASLTGTGQAPASLVGDSASFDFGTVDVSLSSAPFTWTVRNAGDVPSGALTLVQTGDTAQFTLVNGCAAALAPGATCTVVAHFAPNAAGTGARSLAVTVSAAPGGSAALALTGTGRALVALTVIKAGNGGGTVTSAPAGLNCGGVCSASYVFNTRVTLTAAPQTGSNFTSWSGGGCAGTTCVVTLAAATQVIATFTLQRFPLTVTQVTGGTISGAGLTCVGATCTGTYDYNTAVALTQMPTAGYSFAGWTGDCAGPGACSVTMTAARAVSASYSQIQHSITVTTPVNGTVTGPSINCPGTCVGTYAFGTPVTLTANPAAGYQVSTWTGCPSPSGATCVTTVGGADQTIGVSFTPRQFLLTVSAPAGGSVTGNGITCPGTCSVMITYGQAVSLQANAPIGSHVASWGGDCAASGTSFYCGFNMPAANAAASVAWALNTYTVFVDFGRGSSPTMPYTGFSTVTGSGYSCYGGGGSVTAGSGTCSMVLPYGTILNLTVSPDAYSGLAFWSCPPDQVDTNCTITVTADREIVVGAFSHTLTVTDPGLGGNVRSTDGLINCPQGGPIYCYQRYKPGTQVPLTVTGGDYNVWVGGQCAGQSRTCTVVMNAPDTEQPVNEIIP